MHARAMWEREERLEELEQAEVSESDGSTQESK
jgi:hypothetical protein